MGFLFLFFALATTMTEDHNNNNIIAYARVVDGFSECGAARGRTAVTSQRSAETSRVFATRQRAGRGAPARRHRLHIVPGENAFLKNSIPIILDIPIRAVETAARTHSHNHTLSRTHTNTHIDMNGYYTRSVERERARARTYMPQ